MTLPLGTQIRLRDGRLGRIAGMNEWGQYEAMPDEPTPDELARGTKHLFFPQDIRLIGGR